MYKQGKEKIALCFVSFKLCHDEHNQKHRRISLNGALIFFLTKQLYFVFLIQLISTVESLTNTQQNYLKFLQDFISRMR